MSLFETYLDINNELLKAENRKQVNIIINKLNAINPLVLANVNSPAGWNTLKEEDLNIQEYKDLLSFTILGFLQRVPNYNEIKNIYDLIQESKTIDKNAPNQTSPYLRKVNIAVGKEIDFPTSVLSVFNKEDNCFIGVGGHICKTTAQDFEGVVIRLENYFTKLTTPKKENKEKNEQEKIAVNVTQINQNDIHIDIDISINRVLEEIENDDDLSDNDITEIKQILNELKELRNEKPKKKWDKCKEVLKWLGEKSVKFGKWIIPIISQILLNKN